MTGPDADEVIVEGDGWMVLDVEQIEALIDRLEQRPDPFVDDEPLECGIENPDECEACQ